MGSTNSLNVAAHCEICGMAFINGDKLKEHIDMVHIKSLFQCQSCNKVFMYKEEFNNHKKVHSDVLDNNC